MKPLFYAGLFGLLLFEILNVYFIMPMPGSQRMSSIDLAYFLHSWRWVFRIVFFGMLTYGFFKARKHKWFSLVAVLFVSAGIYILNFVMAADHMFYQPRQLLLVGVGANKVDTQRLIIGVAVNGHAKAYPIQFLGYHHQVFDSIGGSPIIVTYCTVCRTGRMFQPIVHGRLEKFRLVGMDHFNAMFEDATTKSWWRQATGEAITGRLKGIKLPEILSTQTSLGEWIRLYPNTLVMQPDPAFITSYDSTLKYENGKSKGSLTRSDSLSWQDKSWVVGVKIGNTTRVYDWNKLKSRRVIQDTIDKTVIGLVLARDNKTFFAFSLLSPGDKLLIQNDTLLIANDKYRLDGQGITTAKSLERRPAYQEFWHSWRTFHPESMRK